MVVVGRAASQVDSDVAANHDFVPFSTGSGLVERRHPTVRDAVRHHALPAHRQGRAEAHDHAAETQVHQECRWCVTSCDKNSTRCYVHSGCTPSTPSCSSLPLTLHRSTSWLRAQTLVPYRKCNFVTITLKPKLQARRSPECFAQMYSALQCSWYEASERAGSQIVMRAGVQVT